MLPIQLFSTHILWLNRQVPRPQTESVYASCLLNFPSCTRSGAGHKIVILLLVTCYILFEVNCNKQRLYTVLGFLRISVLRTTCPYAAAPMATAAWLLLPWLLLQFLLLLWLLLSWMILLWRLLLWLLLLWRLLPWLLHPQKLLCTAAPVADYVAASLAAIP